ncbi:TetR/AcrR family transcriptional regulator [Acrocarpospora macrocephala]|uniref:TetR family transcriptional regulator n=1 Tax=Acrocarpospora macrocephala TaxID=150177 RepID=A0A5M3WV05_9ACTN|nr:helix-turn-helix domain-containing protein [Acrocarpospora macrocephala]GES12052.1 TetR family transcriptional regulator [Acrocarpospora macrocephala]
MRADAQRNRARVLAVAAEIFASEGLSVPVHEIARRAGVGTGTVSRHFPTKEDLFAAVLLERMKELSEQADALTGSPGAFFTFFATLVREAAANRGLAEALGGAGFDVEAAAAQAGYDVTARLNALLASAQESGEVRPDITYPDVKALMAGCLSADLSDPATLDRLVAVVSGGLRGTARDS